MNLLCRSITFRNDIWTIFRSIKNCNQYWSDSRNEQSVPWLPRQRVTVKIKFNMAESNWKNDFFFHFFQLNWNCVFIFFFLLEDTGNSVSQSKSEEEPKTPTKKEMVDSRKSPKTPLGRVTDFLRKSFRSKSDPVSSSDGMSSPSKIASKRARDIFKSKE